MKVYVLLEETYCGDGDYRIVAIYSEKEKACKELRESKYGGCGFKIEEWDVE